MNQTPLQKSIAEIEAKIAINKKQIEDAGVNKPELLKLYSIQYGLQYAKNILTDNLEYEREVIKDAYQQGHDDACDGNAGQRKEFTSGNDYYTKTYEHDNRL